MTLRLLIGLSLVGSVAAGSLAYRFRDGSSGTSSRVEPGLLGGRSGQPFTLLAFTSPLCHSCKQTPAVVAEALGVDEDELGDVEGAVDFETVDVRDRPDLVEALDVTSTPTLVLVDHAGHVRFSSQGNPDPGQLAKALTPPVGV